MIDEGALELTSHNSIILVGRYSYLSLILLNAHGFEL